MEKEISSSKGGKPSLVGMFWSPGEQLGKIRENPRIWGALGIITLLYIIGSAILATNLTAQDLVVPGISLEDAEQILGFTKALTVVSVFIVALLGILISAVIHLIIVKIAGKNVTFKQLFSMNTYIALIGAVGMLLNTLIQISINGDPSIYVTSLGSLFNSDSPILASFEVFSIWQLILTAIGLYKVGQLSKTASWIIAIIFFAISLGFALLGVALEGITGL
ncbi:YIP1 family protein [Robertmurraya massiliosenegalensis]|uniref:YIP1 family protein n=1 Tax=Robertmurraya massiliosenegalensis TaxID=1287657 RepID=UPI0002F78A9A|nr:YIP1 family protein [Robertmurraya massiliosenegalensis]